MSRIENWDKFFIEVFNSKVKEPFSYGTHDCCVSIADCVIAMTGIDAAERFRGFTTKKEAFNYLKRYRDVLGLMIELGEFYKFPEIESNFATRGDVVVVEDEKEGYCLGIIEPNGIYVAAATDPGWKYLPRAGIIRAWSIG